MNPDNQDTGVQPAKPENEDIRDQLATDVQRYYPRLLSMYIDPLYVSVVKRIANEEDAKDIMQNISMCVY
jgi:hypothetical protein